MKVFLDTNVYVAEALLGRAAERMIRATRKASWRIYASAYVFEELEKVLAGRLGFSRRFAILSRRRIRRRVSLVEPGASRHAVPGDPKDSPILRAAMEAGVHYLVTNDQRLLELDPYEGIRIVPTARYHKILAEHGLLG